MAHPILQRDELVRRLLAAFRAHGYEGASLTRLSQATGLVRASLYHAFPGGKAAMAEAVLSAIDAAVEERALAPLRTDAPPRERLEAMLAGFASLYEGGSAPCLFSLFSIGEAGPIFAARVAAAMASIQAAIGRVLAQSGQPPALAATRAEDALISVQGALALARMTGDPGPFQRTMRELPDRLLAV